MTLLNPWYSTTTICPFLYYTQRKQTTSKNEIGNTQTNTTKATKKNAPSRPRFRRSRPRHRSGRGQLRSTQSFRRYFPARWRRRHSPCCWECLWRRRPAFPTCATWWQPCIPRRTIFLRQRPQLLGQSQRRHKPWKETPLLSLAGGGGGVVVVVRVIVVYNYCAGFAFCEDGFDFYSSEKVVVQLADSNDIVDRGVLFFLCVRMRSTRRNAGDNNIIQQLLLRSYCTYTPCIIFCARL